MSGTDLAYDINESSFLPNTMISFDSQSRFQPSYSMFNSTSNAVDGFTTSPVSILSFPDRAYDNQSIVQFQTGIDEASRFFPSVSLIPDGSRGKKNPYFEDLVEDERNLKQSAVYSEPAVKSEMFDDVLLCGGPKTHPFQCDFVCNQDAHKVQSKGFNLVKPRRRKQSEAVDLRILLTLCAQSVSINDQRGVTDLLKCIREHASPTGYGMQRLAHYFLMGLKPVWPDFGILHGFQWPCLIQQLSTRPGGPPEVRIIGIDFPYPSFRPAQRVEETGRRLAHYAETLGVRFKFKAIAQKWETIRIEDLELDDDEMLVVNCGYRFRNLLDETVTVDSPRKKVLDLLRKMNPEIVEVRY
ncbi:scarecrow-like protein 14 [Bidens hawaiensis]|uniref:scarecrow-like protein 14 n=1 Tax=Bidens hawaiensis TaxID=980011 RepID=UPI00404B73FC